MADELDAPPPPEDFPGKGIPSTFVNHFHVLVGQHVSRLTLGEQVFLEAPNYSSSFTIPTSVAKQLAETILQIIAGQEAAAQDTAEPGET